MTVPIEALRLSAEACGLRTEVQNGKVLAWSAAVRGWFSWNPPESPAQDRECLDQLCDRGFTVVYNEEPPDHFKTHGWVHCCFFIRPDVLQRDVVFRQDCARKDFATLALAEVKRREG